MGFVIIVDGESSLKYKQVIHLSNKYLKQENQIQTPCHPNKSPYSEFLLK
jgi:hypothetical protein